MRAHVAALFAHDANGDLVRVNEPNGAPAPRFFLGRTPEGEIVRFRHDVTRDLRRELEAAILGESLAPWDAMPNVTRYATILAQGAPVQKSWTGPAFSFPVVFPGTARIVFPDTSGTVIIERANVELLRPHLEAWLNDVESCSPMLAMIVDGHAVAVCASVRKTSQAHEAGLDTAGPFRGHGYAGRATAAWAMIVREMALVPLYSTSWQNEASRAVARKLSLVAFGSDLHVD